eukprot:54136-Eustigmatos_ZCMA.PRE.1
MTSVNSGLWCHMHLLHAAHRLRQLQCSATVLPGPASPVEATAVPASSRHACASAQSGRFDSVEGYTFLTASRKILRSW